MGYCKGCGASLPDGVTYCPNCGEVVETNTSNAWGTNRPTVDLNKSGFEAPNSRAETGNTGLFEAPDTSNSINDPRFGTANDVYMVGRSNVFVNILGFLFPLIGMIFLALVWRTERMTKKYDSLALCVFVSMCLGVVWSFVSALILIIALFTSF